MEKRSLIIIKVSLLEGTTKIYFTLVLLHSNFKFTRPLTVTGAYRKKDEDVFFHQMILDRVEGDQYVLQNTLHSHSSKKEKSQLRIYVQNCYYADKDLMDDCLQAYGRYDYHGPNGEFLQLANEECGNTMYSDQWYLLPQAYSIILTK